MKSVLPQSRCSAFTMIEMMVAITIVGILAVMAFPAFNKLKNNAYDAVTTNNLKQLVNATITWAAEHSDRIPSPEYPGGHQGELPDYVGAGRWLDGVVFASVYRERGDENLSSEEGDTSESQDPENWDPTGISVPGVEAGGHLVGTIFECKASVKNLSSIRDWYKHSFAMNANLQYDDINEDSPNPWLTEKAMGKFELSNAMLFIDCMEENVIMAEDIQLLEETAEERYGGKHVLAAFLDGNIQKIKPDEIPSGNVETERRSSLFWRGVREKR